MKNLSGLMKQAQQMQAKMAEMQENLGNLLVEASERVPAGTFEKLLPRLVVTTGSQQLLYLVTEALIDGPAPSQTLH